MTLVLEVVLTGGSAEPVDASCMCLLRACILHQLSNAKSHICKLIIHFLLILSDDQLKYTVSCMDLSAVLFMRSDAQN